MQGLVRGTRDWWGEPGIGGGKTEDAVEVVSPSDQYHQAIRTRVAQESGHSRGMKFDALHKRTRCQESPIRVV